MNHMFTICAEKGICKGLPHHPTQMYSHDWQRIKERDSAKTTLHRTSRTAIFISHSSVMKATNCIQKCFNIGRETFGKWEVIPINEAQCIFSHIIMNELFDAIDMMGIPTFKPSDSSRTQRVYGIGPSSTAILFASKIIAWHNISVGFFPRNFWQWSAHDLLVQYICVPKIMWTDLSTFSKT